VGWSVAGCACCQYEQVMMGFASFLRNITLIGGVARARAYIEELVPEVLERTIEPGRIFDRTVGLDEVPDGYRAMAPVRR
jgi:threonine dehydrogenase-like Zn-dependent dehydrogenase